MFFPVLFATQKLSALLLMTFYVHEIAGTVSDGIPDQWPLILPRTAGLAIAALGLFRPKPGYARKNLNSFLLLSSLAATLLLLLNILVEALGMMQPFWGAPPEIQVAFAVGHFLISLPDLLLKIRRFSLRTLSPRRSGSRLLRNNYRQSVLCADEVGGRGKNRSSTIFSV